jgi:photosystem II stability/assembly factor-like uncharacterized protein
MIKMKIISSLILFLALSVPAQDIPTLYDLGTIPVSTDFNRYEDVYFINPLIGWTCNSNGEVYKTTDGGISWELKFSTSPRLRAITFVDENYGWLGKVDPAGGPGDTTIFYGTTDGGDSWSELLLPEPRPRGICSLYPVNDLVVYGGGRYSGNPTLIKTTDRGNTWRSIDLSSYIATVIDCYFFTADSGLVTGGTGNLSTGFGKVIRTNDGGNTWELLFESTFRGTGFWKINFVNESDGYISFQSYDTNLRFIKTTDGGNSWAEMTFSVGDLYSPQGIGFISPEIGWIGDWPRSGFSGPNDTYLTTDAGSTWSRVNQGENINRFRFFGDTLGYASGKSIYKISYDPVVKVNGTDASIEGYRLYQNFPNPFNPVTIIKFSIPNLVAGQLVPQRRDAPSQKIRLVIYDLLGNEIETLVNEQKSPGIYEIKFNAKGLSSGIYFYELSLDSFSDTKKFVLLK